VERVASLQANIGNFFIQTHNVYTAITSTATVINFFKVSAVSACLHALKIVHFSQSCICTSRGASNPMNGGILHTPTAYSSHAQ